MSTRPNPDAGSEIEPKPAGKSPPRAARLALVDGSVYRGEAFGAQGVTRTAEVVFNTAMSGYQESLTDPSYTGQILVATAPMMGNYGANPVDVESGRVQVAGFAVREIAERHSNYRANESLSDYLAAQGILGISGIDTRSLTRRLRSDGSMNGVLSDDESLTDQQLVEMAKAAPSMAGANLVEDVKRSTPDRWTEDLGPWTTSKTLGEARFRVIALDCGAKRNILRNLTDRGCAVTVVPHTIPAAEVIQRFEADEIDGLFVSNGPGDPAAVEETIALLKDILGSGVKLPVFGICLGHQLLSLAAGAETFKLPFGHRGANQPVRNHLTGGVEITSQNHGFAVTPESVEAIGAEVTHTNLNDHTVAGFRFADRPVFAVQHHPEASPGPHDAGYLFDAFVRMMETREPVEFAGANG